MNEDRLSNVKAAGRAAWARSLKPLQKARIYEGEIVGLDSEYDSKTRKFICWTIWARGRGILLRRKSFGALVAAAGDLAASEGPLAFITFFSLAELQHMPTFSDAKKFFTGGRGSLDAEFEVRGRRILVFDLARFFEGQSLATVARSFGYRKFAFDTTRVTQSCLRSPRFRAYAIHDARLVHDICNDLRKATLPEGIDILEARTPAGTASRVFRLKHLKHDVKNPEPRIRTLAMRCLWGGRAEAFQRGHLPHVFEYDLISAYPNAAISLHEMPRGGDWKGMPYEEGIGGVCRVRFEFPAGAIYPCLPIFADGKLLFPLRGESFCTFHEARLAARMGASLESVESYGYEEGTTALSRFLKKVLAERKTATGARSIALKLYANSLIGKFVQTRRDLSLETIRQFARKNQVSLYDVAQLNPDDRAQLGLVGRANLGGAWCPEWNCLITGFVRAQIGGFLQAHGGAYASTDAVWTTEKLPDTPEGYSLKREGPATIARSRLAAIWTGKDPHVVFHSFCRRDAAEGILREFDGLKDLHTLYKFSRPVKPKEALRRGKPLGLWEEFERTGQTAWDGKRRLLVDGTSRPWESVEEYWAWKKTASS